MTILTTHSTQIEVNITAIHRFADGTAVINGWKRNKHLDAGLGAPFGVYVSRDGELSKVNGLGRPHPKLVMAAASAAFLNAGREG